MTVFTDTWRFLVQHKLWPVAILLVAAAAAVPFLLGKEPAAPAGPATASAVKSDKDSTLASEPIVALAGDADRSDRRHVLGSPKNPFKPNATPTPEPTATSAGSGGGTVAGATGATGDAVSAARAPTAPGSTAGAPTTLGGTTDAPGGTVGAPGSMSPVTPVTHKKKKYELFELSVRFRASEDGQPPRRDVKRLEALPSSSNPVLIYLGVLKDEKTAVFMVDSGLVAQGDGTCKPSPTVCETIQLKEGETEFFDVESDDPSSPGAQYQLDVVKIHRTETTSAKHAKRSRARVSQAGRKILRARVAGDGPLRYRYDAESGRLEQLSKKAFKAAVAKAAKAARAQF